MESKHSWCSTTQALVSIVAYLPHFIGISIVAMVIFPLRFFPSNPCRFSFFPSHGGKCEEADLWQPAETIDKCSRRISTVFERKKRKYGHIEWREDMTLNQFLLHSFSFIFLLQEIWLIYYDLSVAIQYVLCFHKLL